MSLYETLYGRALFPAYDRLKGRKTVRFWRDAESSQWLDREVLEARQFEDLKSIIAYAYDHCDYYREHWGSLGLSPQQLRSREDLHHWPTITRESISENRSRMQSRQSLKRFSKTTGGSTGQPLVFELDSGSNDRRTAMTLRGYGWAGCRVGVRRLLIWGANFDPPGLLRRLKLSLHHRFNHQLHLNCFEFTEDNMRHQFEAMQRFGPESIVAYTNPLYEFARFLHENGWVPRGIRSIVVGAEKLYGFQRQKIEEVFRAPVFETYGSREFMLIGAECERHSGLHLSMENLLVEVLDDDGNPTPQGQEGNVVVTDLFNRAMPFIRYINGDRAIAGFSQCSCGRGLPLLQSVVGRQLDVIKTQSGHLIPGEWFPHFFKDFSYVRRFQVQQHHIDQLDIQIVGNRSMTDEHLQSMQDQISQLLGQRIQVHLQRVSGVPLTHAGKLQVVINHLARTQRQS